MTQVSVSKECSNCFYSDEISNTNVPTITIGDTVIICRNLPPSVVLLTRTTSEGTTQGFASMHPQVKAGMWCHQYRPKSGMLT